VIVIDASAVVEMCITTQVGKRLAIEILANKTAMVAPEIMSLEVIQALRKQKNLKLISEVEATEAFDVFCQMPVQFESHTNLLERVWELRTNMTAYDASYVALAEILRAPIWTCDRKYQNTPTHKAKSVFFDPRPIIVTPL
jgi:predicted nucleic acid-binding protein